MRRALILGGSLLVTVALFAVAFVLGAQYFKLRRFATHETRLQRLLPQEPTIEQITVGLHDEGSTLVDAPEGDAALRKATARWGDQKREEILAKGRRWPTTRVFLAGDMVYFIFFDSQGVMKDFTCVSG
jgi:outer membrane lipopolysaccharide assembly protein LptE/RlpB